MRPEEYDVNELGRLMIASNELQEGVADLDVAGTTEAEDDDLVDARYYATKLYRILARLAVKAEHEWKQAQQEAGDDTGVGLDPHTSADPR